MKELLAYIVGGVISAIIVIMAILFVVVLFHIPANAHEFYDMWCCHDTDCMPLPEGSVTEESDGYHVQPFRGIDHVTVVRYNDKTTIKQSPDGRFHGCEYPANTLRCLYVPGRSF